MMKKRTNRVGADVDSAHNSVENMAQIDVNVTRTKISVFAYTSTRSIPPLLTVFT